MLLKPRKPPTKKHPTLLSRDYLFNIEVYFMTYDSMKKMKKTRARGRYRAMAVAQRELLKLLRNFGIGDYWSGYDDEKIKQLRYIGYRMTYASGLAHATQLQLAKSEIKDWIMLFDINQ